MNYNNINFFIINHTNINLYDLSQFDCVYSPAIPIDVSKYPNTKFIFGPHFSVFPEKNHMDIINKSKNTIYIQPSEWVVQLWNTYHYCNNIKIKALPFGVDTNKFINIKTISEKKLVFIYFKRRNTIELNFLLDFLQSKNIEFKIFNYTEKYSEEEYINYLQNSKFGIWLDAHESQGFALEEALSCDVPLLVWNISSMNQEYGSNYTNISATTIPYWDERCGEYFYDVNELDNIFDKFISKLNNYKPREYILENLTFEKCEEKLINIYKN